MPYKNPDVRRAYAREWIKRNAERARQAMRRWRRAHPADHSQEVRAYYARHRDEVALRVSKYQREHPDLMRTAKQQYRARRVSADGSFTTAEWLALVEQYGGRCAYCGGPGPLVQEHRVPLSRGGTNDITNILPACARCNNKKHRLTDEEFRARLAAEAGKLESLRLGSSVVRATDS